MKCTSNVMDRGSYMVRKYRVVYNDGKGKITTAVVYGRLELANMRQNYVVSAVRELS